MVASSWGLACYLDFHGLREPQALEIQTVKLRDKGAQEIEYLE